VGLNSFWYNNGDFSGWDWIVSGTIMGTLVGGSG
jgi:hypothetical protein